MNLTTVLRSLGPIDIRNIRRDSLISWMVFLPIMLALILRWSVPPLNVRLLEQYNFDLVEYYPVLLAYFFIGMSPMVYGVVTGFLLLDEKDDRTLTALQVTPLPLNSYIIYRVAVPIILTFVLMFAIFPLANLTPFNVRTILISAIAAAPMAPMLALLLASFAQNKVQGFALMKLTGIVLFAPILAYFAPQGWELAFGIFPTYWPMKVYWLLYEGATNVWLYVFIAVVYQSLVTVFLARRFYKVLHQ
jgi:fluoroquinolone transport system permease protein